MFYEHRKNGLMKKYTLLFLTVILSSFVQQLRAEFISADWMGPVLTSDTTSIYCYYDMDADADAIDVEDITITIADENILMLAQLEIVEQKTGSEDDSYCRFVMHLVGKSEGETMVTLKAGTSTDSGTVKVLDRKDYEFTLDVKELILSPDETWQLSPQWVDESKDGWPTLYCYTLDDDVVNVTENGVITGRSEGVATVYAANDYYSVTVEVVVFRDNWSVPQLAFSPSETIVLSKDTMVDVTCMLHHISIVKDGSEIEYEFSDEQIAEVVSVSEFYHVDSIGDVEENYVLLTLRGLSVGETELTVSYGEYSVTETVQVHPSKKDCQFSIDSNEMDLLIEETYQVNVEFEGDDVENYIDAAITWKSTNEDIVQVSSDGLITPVGVGKAVVLIYNKYWSESVYVVVYENYLGENDLEIDFGFDTLKMNVGEYYSFKDLDLGSTTRFTIEDRDMAIAGLDSVMILYAFAEGQTIITAKNYTYEDEFVLIVSPEVVDSVYFDRPVYQVSVGTSIQTQLVGADDIGNVEFGVGDESIASISEGGLLSGLQLGETFVYTTNGVDTITAVVEVVDQTIPQDSIDGVEFNTIYLYVAVDDSTSIDVYSLLTSEPIQKGVEWRVGDESLATVSNNGVIKGLQEGWTELYASTPNSEASISLIVVSKEEYAYSDVSITVENPYIYVGDTIQLQAVSNITGEILEGGLHWHWAYSQSSLDMIDGDRLVALKQGTGTVGVRTLEFISDELEIFVVDDSLKLEIETTYMKSPSSLAIEFTGEIALSNLDSIVEMFNIEFVKHSSQKSAGELSVVNAWVDQDHRTLIIEFSRDLAVDESITVSSDHIVQSTAKCSVGFKVTVGQVSTSTDALLSRAEIQLYPNPVHNILNIKSEQSIQELYILDMNGKVVRREVDVHNPLNVSDLQKGVYLIQVCYSDQVVETKRFIKE